MHCTTWVRLFRPRLVAAACALAAVAGCTVHDQEMPGLSGPSGFGLSLVLTATPDILQRDGSSRSVIKLVARDHEAKPINGQMFALTMSGTPTNGGQLSVGQVTTGSDGSATFEFIAPDVNQNVSSVSVVAVPVGSNFDNAQSKSVRIALAGPAIPQAAFTFTPAQPTGAELITFDASTTTLDGAACGTTCSYSWNFGDGSSASGVLAQHSFTTVGVQSVTLTVTAPSGTSNSITKSFANAPPAAPVANFTVTPTNPAPGAGATFDATSSTVGIGATIVQYSWNWGDGSANTVTTLPGVAHTFGVAGTYPVMLTITDNLGRTAVKVVGVTVQ